MADKKRDALRDLCANTEKALRRSEKLERTLLKIIAQSEPGTAAEDFLKAVRLGMRELRREAKATERSLASGKKKMKKAGVPEAAAAVPLVQIVRRSSRKAAANPNTASAPDMANS